MKGRTGSHKAVSAHTSRGTSRFRYSVPWSGRAFDTRRTRRYYLRAGSRIVQAAQRSIKGEGVSPGFMLDGTL